MNAAILVAAGKGTRMGPQAWTNCFSKWPAALSSRTRGSDSTTRNASAKSFWSCARECSRHSRNWRQNSNFKNHFASSSAARNGRTRSGTAWRRCPPTAEIVAIHDAARPCTSEELIAATIKRAAETGAAVAAQPVTDTIKESADGRFDATHARPFAAVVGANAADVSRRGHPPRAGGGAPLQTDVHGRHGGVRIDRPAGPARVGSRPIPKSPCPATCRSFEIVAAERRTVTRIFSLRVL